MPNLMFPIPDHRYLKRASCMRCVLWLGIMFFMYGCGINTARVEQRPEKPVYWGNHQAATSPVYEIIEISYANGKGGILARNPLVEGVRYEFIVSETTGLFQQRVGTQESEYLADPISFDMLAPGVLARIYTEGEIMTSNPAVGFVGEIIMLD